MRSISWRLTASAGDDIAVAFKRVLGVRVGCVDMVEAVAVIERLIEARGPLQLVATTNPEFIMRARRDPEFRRVLEHSALCVPDGIGLVWALRRQGVDQQERVAGSDLVPALADLCARRGWRPFLLGARPGVGAEAARRLEKRYPGLRVAGTHAGSPLPADDEETLRRIEAARPDLLLVGYGHPRQEFWVERNRDRLAVPVAIGVGGTFDFLAGRVKRAPEIVRRVHLEWFWRLLLQPWRIRRMWVLPVFALAVARRREV